jgi:transcriptional regulator GlxA family with amidase domain
MEVLDYAGPYEVFNVAAECAPEASLQVQAIGLADGPVAGRGGFKIHPHATIGSCPPPDILIVPGGAGTRALLHDRRVIDWVRLAAKEAEMVLSVCTGALVLAAGLIGNAPATTHHEAFHELAALSPATTIIEGRRFVQSSDRLWTSAGVSAGIDLALHAVELLLGADIRGDVVEEMEWGW